jgi:YidC/Oxa1 family membrane protein insertase
MFFFILYNAPSGLILYWTVMNIFTVFQQEATNLIRKHKVEEEKANPTLKIVKPPSKKTGAGKPSQGKKKR